MICHARLRRRCHPPYSIHPHDVIRSPLQGVRCRDRLIRNSPGCNEMGFRSCIPLQSRFDDSLPSIVQKFLSLSDSQTTQLRDHLKGQTSVQIPYQFLPLQDCVDLAIFLIRTTITLQTWLVGIRGVGGIIDVATITRTDGFKPVQQKKILGERVSYVNSMLP
jgi:hypothetical protein